MKSTDLLRIEHKLDALLFYLREMTHQPPRTMPKPIPGMGGMTDGTCPITNSSIHYFIDVATGDVRRKDGLDVGLVEAPLPTLNTHENKSVMLGGDIGGSVEND